MNDLKLRRATTLARFAARKLAARRYRDHEKHEAALRHWRQVPVLTQWLSGRGR